MRVLNVARGPLIVDEDLQAALDSRQGRAARRSTSSAPSRSPSTRSSAYPNVIVTPHLGASTAEATDRAGYQAAEQVVAALTGGSVTTAVNVPAVAAEDLEVLGPFLPLCRQLGRLGDRARRGRVDRPRRGRVPRPHRRARHAARSRSRRCSACSRATPRRRSTRSTRPAIAEERGIEVVETKRTSARDFADLVRVTVVTGDRRERVVGTTLGRRHRPHLLEAWGQRFNLQLERPRRAVPLPATSRA